MSKIVPVVMVAALKGQGTGNDWRPSFLHRVYELMHHTEVAFQWAVINDQKGHH
jgi:hypothetical protein